MNKFGTVVVWVLLAVVIAALVIWKVQIYS